MTGYRNRRAFLLAAASMPLVAAFAARANEMTLPDSAAAMLASLEAASGGRLGVYAMNMADGTQVRHRENERFPLCSTFKVILVSAILARSAHIAGLMQQRIHYAQSDLAHYSPVSEKHFNDGMTVAELCAAAIQYSDNTSANLLMKILGGPSVVTAFARTIGNGEFHLDRWETDLNTAVPGDPRDTATPAAMGRSLQALALGEILPALQRQQLNEWLLGNTTGAKRIRAALPAAWQVGDKTGSGDYGTANDIAVLWPPEREPIVMSIYHTQEKADAKWRDEVVADAARIVVNALGLTAGRAAPSR